MFDSNGYDSTTGAILVAFKVHPDSSRPIFTFGLVHPDYEQTLTTARQVLSSSGAAPSAHVDLALRVQFTGLWTTCRIPNVDVWAGLYPILRGPLVKASSPGDNPLVGVIDDDQPSGGPPGSFLPRTASTVHGPSPYHIIEIRPAAEPKVPSAIDGMGLEGYGKEKESRASTGFGGMGFSIGGIKLG